MKKMYLLIAVCLPLFSIAQSNYKVGYVIDIKGDTLRGYIDQKEWGHNPKSISFKPTPAGKVQQLGLSVINYFEIPGYLGYRKYAVTISLNTVDIASPSSISDTASVTDTVLLKILEKGKNLTLYAYKDELKERYYIKDNDLGSPVELLYGIYQDARNSDNTISKNTFQIQLMRMAVKYKCSTDKLVREIHQSDYKEDDLIQIAAQINGNTQAQAALKSANSSAVRFFAGAAFISGSLKDGQYYGSPTSVSTSPKIGIGIDAIVNPGVGHLIFRMELAFSIDKFSFNDRPDPIYNILNPQTNKINTIKDVIFLTPQVVYNIYNTNNFKVFLDLGYSINILSNVKNEVTTYQYGQPITPTQNYEAMYSKGYYCTFQFKAGVVVNKRFEIYGSYFPSADIANSVTYSTSLISYQLGLNYFLGKASR